MSKKVICMILALCLASPLPAAKIILVSENYDVDGNGQQDDQGLEDFLKSLPGHEIDVQRGYWTTLDSAKIAALNAADLVIISRSANSANYATDATEINQWHSIETPILLTHAYIARNNRCQWVNTTTINNLVGPSMEVLEPTHPIFAGIKLDPGNLLAVVDSTTGTGQTSFIGTLDVGNGKVLAKTGNNAWIVEWEPGKPFYTGSGTPAAKRLLFCCQTQEVGATPQGAFNLTDVGKKVFTNAINYLLGIVADPGVASTPVPKDKATDVPRDVVLAWTAGMYPCTHDVYFGQDPAAVEAASRTNPNGLLVARDLTITSYDPAGLLEFGQKYYWRIDEVNTSPDKTVHKGPVWGFEVEPYSYAIKPVSATASSSHNANMGPEKTIDGSGLDNQDRHGTDDKTMWLSHATGPKPDWIQYEFDKVYKLDKVLVWNFNQVVEPILGFGAWQVLIQASVDGQTWTDVGTYELDQGLGEPSKPNTVVDLGGAIGKYIRLTINSTWGGMAQSGLSEVRFYQVPIRAFGPTPADGATGVALGTVLDFRPGRDAIGHKLYLGTDRDAVLNGTVSPVTLQDHKVPLAEFGPLYAAKYYWKVDELTDSVTWPGDLWSFDTAQYLVVDDFDSYDNTCNRIYFAWIDSLGPGDKPECGITGIAGNGTGGVVGNDNAPFAERSIVHGGSQSMPFRFDNSRLPYYSEATRTFASEQDWTVGGVDTLTIYLRGEPAAFVELSPGNIVMNGIGTDIWNTADEFRFVYKALTGNGWIVARVDGLTDTDPWSKAGVMIRETLDAGSVWAAVFMTGNNGVRFQSRPTANSACSSDSSIATAEQIALREPTWVKIERVGNQFNGYYSKDGVNWTSMVWNPQTITMANQVYIGLALTSHTTSAVAGARFSNVATSSNVTGTWQVAEIGATAQVQGNSLEPFYVVVEDGLGGKRMVVDPDPAAIASGIWERWDIPLKELTSAGVRLNRIKRLTIGVGDRTSPRQGSTGKLYIDDIQLTRLGN